jgi:serine/threonine protein kinase
MNHPNICQLYDVGPKYLVMELVEGEALQGPVPLAEALRIGSQIIEALEAAHEKGIMLCATPQVPAAEAGARTATSSPR